VTDSVPAVLVEIVVSTPALEVELGIPGPPGPPGPPGDIGNISNDPGNALTAGSDQGLYVPDDITADPLAYYILSRS
jgi:hypothetical protein